MQRKINMLLLVFSLLGGAIAFTAGELLLDRTLEEWPSILVVGIYFAIAALGIGLGCLVAEAISPRLNGMSWRRRYLGLSWKLLPLMVALLLGVGALMEFVYELNFGGMKPVANIVMVIDDSGSMSQSDPDNSRYRAAEALVQRMDKGRQVAVITFNNTVTVAQPLTPLSKNENRDQVLQAIESLQTTEGGTNLGGALNEAMKVIQSDDAANRGSMVILLSDGISEFDTASELAEYQNRDVAVNTIGLAMNDPAGAKLLQDIATATGGQFYDVTTADRLGGVFTQIYDRLGDRTLLTLRDDNTADSPYYAVVRILSLLLVGIALGIGLGILFDNRHLAKSFGFGGAVSGLIAGLILEFGLSGHSFGDAVIRLIALLVLAGIIALFTLIVPVGEGRLTRRGSRQAAGHAQESNGFQSPRRGRGSQGF